MEIKLIASSKQINKRSSANKQVFTKTHIWMEKNVKSENGLSFLFFFIIKLEYTAF